MIRTRFRFRPIMAAVISAGLLVSAAACTSTAAGGPTMTMGTLNNSSVAGSTATSSSPPSSSSTPSSGSTAPTPPTSKTHPPVTSSTATTISSAPPSNPWPANLKSAQVKDAQAALKTYRSFNDTLNAAYAAPRKSWAHQITVLTAEPVRSQQLTALVTTAKKGQTMTGAVVVEPTVIKVGTGDVYLRSCVDTSATQFSAGGKILEKLSDVKGSYLRHLQMATVTKYADGTWRISAIDEQNWATKC